MRLGLGLLSPRLDPRRVHRRSSRRSRPRSGPRRGSPASHSWLPASGALFRRRRASACWTGAPRGSWPGDVAGLRCVGHGSSVRRRRVARPGPRRCRSAGGCAARRRRPPPFSGRRGLAGIRRAADISSVSYGAPRRHGRRVRVGVEERRDAGEDLPAGGLVGRPDEADGRHPVTDAVTGEQLAWRKNAVLNGSKRGLAARAARDATSRVPGPPPARAAISVPSAGPSAPARYAGSTAGRDGREVGAPGVSARAAGHRTSGRLGDVTASMEAAGSGIPFAVPSRISAPGLVAARRSRMRPWARPR